MNKKVISFLDTSVPITEEQKKVLIKMKKIIGNQQKNVLAEFYK